MARRKNKNNQGNSINVHTDEFKNATRLLWVYNRYLSQEEVLTARKCGLALPEPAGWGTGFFVEKMVVKWMRSVPKIFLVTNRHVLEGAKQVWFKPQIAPGTPAVAEVVIFVEGKVQIAPDLDLAVVDVTDRILDLQKKFPNIQLDPISYDRLPTGPGQLSILEGGTPIAFLGYVDAKSRDNNPARGIGEVSESSRNQSDFLVSTTPTITHGASGSPTFATIGARSKLIGIATEMEYQDINAPNVQFKTTTYGHVLKASALKDLLDRLS